MGAIAHPGQKGRENNAHQLQTALAHTDRAKHEEGEHQVAHDDPGDHVGEQDQCLVQPAGELGGDLIEQDGHRDGHHRPHHDEGQIVQHRVLRHVQGLGGGEQVAEIGESRPVAPQDPLVPVDLLERDHQSEHGRVIVDAQIDDPRQHHAVDRQGVPPVPLLFLLHPRPFPPLTNTH